MLLFVLFFSHMSVKIKFSSTINMQRKGSKKRLPCRGLLPFYEIMKLGYLQNAHLNGPKIKNLYFFYLDHVKLFFQNTLHSQLFNCELITPALRMNLHFSQKHTPKSPKLSVVTNFRCGNEV